MNASSDRRLLSIWLERFRTDRIARRSPTAKPRVVVAKQANALRLLAVDGAAEARGLHAGLSLSDARARRPEIDVVEADPAADEACLRALAEIGRRYTPVVALDPPDGLILDVTGCAHLWGGEHGLIESLAGKLNHQGFSARTGLGDTIGIAWALARFGEAAVLIAGPGEREGPLSPLPISALRLDGEVVEALARVGLKRIGQLLDQPRGPLARRFGAALLERLDQAVGLRSEALKPEREVPPCRVERRLFDPVVSEEAVIGLVAHLGGRLCERLEAGGEGGRVFGLELFRVDGAVKRLRVRSSVPLRDPVRIAALFAERVASLNEGLEADFGFDVLRLWALQTEPVEVAAPALPALTLGRDRAGDLASLVDRLAARLGSSAVRKASPRNEHQPEAAVELRPLGEIPRTAPKWAEQDPPLFAGAQLRPLRLFKRPERIEALAEAPEGPPLRFTWRRVARRVVKAEGPERVAGDWRDPAPACWTRDYWRIEDEAGRRYWMFRQGLYGAETDQPRWFLHGLFA